MLIFKISKNFKYLISQGPIQNRSTRAHKLDQNKILLVGMVDSPHFHKWLSAIFTALPSKQVLIFPSDRPRFSDKKVVLSVEKQRFMQVFKLFPTTRINFVLYYVLDILFGLKWRAYFLAKFIIKHKPAIIHFHEMQHGAYIYNLIVNYQKVPNNSHNIISTWGSDLTLFSWVDKHQMQIRSCLNWADVLTAEKEVELDDALRLGFKGKFLAPIYITLGEKLQSEFGYSKPSSRNVILVKGHQSETGRALNALIVIAGMRRELKNFEIIVYSAPESVRTQVDLLRNKHQLDIKVTGKIANDEMKALFQKARVAISLAISDGLPGVLVEAMAAGAFPIHSQNSAAQRFITHGESGFIVNPWDFDEIRESLYKAITDDALIDDAFDLNLKSLTKNYDYNVGVAKLKQLYL
jgi:glycosyltransferase involved in cell wall biosynthesis